MDLPAAAADGAGADPVLPCEDIERRYNEVARQRIQREDTPE